MPLPTRSQRARVVRGLGEELREGLKEGIAEAGPRAILQWIGIGAGVCVALLVAVVVIGDLTDDTHGLAGRTSGFARSNASLADRGTGDGAPLSSRREPNETDELDDNPPVAATPITSSPAGTDFELPDNATPAHRTAAAKTHAVKQGKLHIVRNAPY